LSCSVGGTLLAAACAVTAAWTIATAFRGEWLWVRPTENLALAFCLTILAVTLSDWLTRLVIEHF
jgi:hypothetical protein